jgi:hypothetical protein
VIDILRQVGRESLPLIFRNVFYYFGDPIEEGAKIRGGVAGNLRGGRVS